MNSQQTKLVDLTKKLEQKTLEYKDLCNQLEEYKKKNIDPNDILYLNLSKRFVKNQEEINQIITELNELNKK